MKTLTLLMLILMSACTTQAPIMQAPPLFHDALFEKAHVDFNPNDIFKLNEDMLNYINIDLARQRRSDGNELALYNALYNKREMRINYDARRTKTAVETFNDRAGNCLSLVIMTAAFAKAMDFPVTYQDVHVEEQMSHIDDLYFSSRHVNILIGKKSTALIRDNIDEQLLKIDFLSPRETFGQIAKTIGENTIIAMYLNNRAAEILAEKKHAQAYWWLRQAIQIDPSYSPAYNTLGIIYWQKGYYQYAKPALEYALALEPDNLNVMSNLAQIYLLNGELERGEKLAAYVKENRPAPYLHYLRMGKAEMNSANYAEAKTLFIKELKREPEHHEVHFWLALAHYRLNELNEAKIHMSKAQEFGYTETDKRVYASKLNALRKLSHH